MEGASTQPRAPRPAAGKKEKGKVGKEGKEGVGKKGKKRGFEDDGVEKKGGVDFVKWEVEPEGAGAGAGGRVKRECSGMRIKNEQDAYTAQSAIQIKSEPGLLLDARPAIVEASPAIRVKRELEIAVDDPNNPDVWRVLPQTTASGISVHDRTPRSTPSPAFASATQPPPPLLHQIPLHSTISLAELEVSPRPQPPATSLAEAGISRSNFSGGRGLAPQRVPDGSAVDAVHIKAEPVPDMDWMVSRPRDGVVVKGEPVETVM